MKSIQQLFPASQTNAELDLYGTYLGHRLHTIGTIQQPMVYANFLTSLDGRIALTDPDTGLSATPKSLTSNEDFRLFQELQAQADCLITHGGYMRSLAQGRLGNILQVGVREDATDLLDYRQQQGLVKQPDIIIASASLDFPMHPSVERFGQKVTIATGAQADQQKVKYWQQQGYEVIVAGDHYVQGKPLIDQLSERGYLSIYLIAGPQILETILASQQLQRLYLTTSYTLLGGDQYYSLIVGSELSSALHCCLHEQYFIPQSSNGQGQLFSCYGFGL